MAGANSILAPCLPRTNSLFFQFLFPVCKMKFPVISAVPMQLDSQSRPERRAIKSFREFRAAKKSLFSPISGKNLERAPGASARRAFPWAKVQHSVLHAKCGEGCHLVPRLIFKN